MEAITSVTFTSAELQEITSWYNQSSAAGNRAAMYTGIANILRQKLQYASQADKATLQQDILWLEGASQANSGSGVYSALIRAYTEAQAECRMNTSVTGNTMQLASNGVGDSVYTTIQQMNGSIPNIENIANDDATSVGNIIFKPTIPADSASTRNAGWSGTVLFSMLGSNQTGLLVQNGSSVQTVDDARNILLAMYSLKQGLQSAWSAGESEAVGRVLDLV